MKSSGDGKRVVAIRHAPKFFLEENPCLTLILAAHPDDEVIGASTVLTMMGKSVFVVFLTDGAPLDSGLRSSHHELSRSEYASLRWQEAESALAVAGVPKENIFFLGGVDQQAVQALPVLARRFSTVIADVRPEMVITHPYEGGHPDHDSASIVAYAVSAVADHPPQVLEMTSYHGATGRFRCGQFLPWSGGPNDEFSIQLSGEQRERKREMLWCYESQRSVLLAFAASMDEERFRSAPDYDFTMPPHPGALWYETQGWSITGEEWRHYAEAFLEQQGLGRQTLRCA